MTLQESKGIIEEVEGRIRAWHTNAGLEDLQARELIGPLAVQVRQAGLLLFHEGERDWSKRAIDLLLDLADVADGIEIVKEPDSAGFQTL